jgi:hypothetical protein
MPCCCCPVLLLLCTIAALYCCCPVLLLPCTVAALYCCCPVLLLPCIVALKFLRCPPTPAAHLTLKTTPNLCPSVRPAAPPEHHSNNCNAQAWDM